MDTKNTGDNSFEAFRKVFYTYLEEHGFSRTAERYAVIKEVYELSGHFDVETLYVHFKQKKYQVSRTTLYHTLDLLEDSGLVRKYRFDDGPAVYECAFRQPPHDHILLSDTGETIEFSHPLVEELIRSLEETHHIRITGRSVTFHAKSR